MLYLLLLAQASAATANPPVLPNAELVRGPTPAENHWLSAPHRNMNDLMFPDLAVKDMRIEGNTLYVLVANEGKARAQNVRVTARTGKMEATAHVGRLMAHESRWVPVNGVALADGSSVSASINQPAGIPSALDRSGRGREEALDPNAANNVFTAAASAIPHGRP